MSEAVAALLATSALLAFRLRLRLLGQLSDQPVKPLFVCVRFKLAGGLAELVSLR